MDIQDLASIIYEGEEDTDEPLHANRPNELVLNAKNTVKAAGQSLKERFTPSPARNRRGSAGRLQSKPRRVLRW